MVESVGSALLASTELSSATVAVGRHLAHCIYTHVRYPLKDTGTSWWITAGNVSELRLQVGSITDSNIATDKKNPVGRYGATVQYSPSPFG
jgi:hypothetical protein